MYQRDYVLRMIEMIGELIAQILGLLKKRNTKKATQILENAYRDFLKEDASFFRSLPKENLTNSLLQEHNYTDEHLQVLAELFYAEAEIQSAKEQKTLANEYYEKSLILFSFVVENSTNFSIRLEQRINLLEKNMNHSL
ncbi:hypothetical protein [Marinifilum sp. D714]|uniref:hypothetical protein n=1 Tax=Marinifilum sp. D714 TaxID=2937523 RepID=UPI0027D14A4C|nr:hypothetical protein [Marinifilum sp. D714]MDQ2180489.1 hypothetical protein [Marinifilum sp. D714]